MSDLSSDVCSSDLFERKGMSGNTPPRREAGQGTAGTISARTQGGGGLGTDLELGGGLQPIGFGGGNRSGPIDKPACLTAKGQRTDVEEIGRAPDRERVGQEGEDWGVGGCLENK